MFWHQIAVIALLQLLWGRLSVSVLVWQSVPPARIQYSNSSGVRLRCAVTDLPADGSSNGPPTAADDAGAPPTITWLDGDGAPLLDLPPIRSVYENGSLVFHPFAAHQWASHAHSAVYRCRAAVAASPDRGLILSPPAHVQAVVDSWWSVSVRVVSEGALLRCGGEGGAVGGWRWYRDLRPVADSDEDASVSSDGALLALWRRRLGETTRYHCVASHSLTGDTRRSETVTVTHTDRESNLPPRIVHAGAVQVMAGAPTRLLCVASGAGPMAYSWQGPGQAQGGWPARSPRGLLALPAARPELAGRWRCSASNGRGEASADVLLTVIEPLIVTVQPKLHVADAGSTVTFTCTVRGGADGGMRIGEDGLRTGADGLRTGADGPRWLHDGQPAGSGRRLTVTGSRHSRGHYQCEVARGADAASDSAELRLGESPPELVDTFIEQAVLGGAALSLRCRAGGTPLPNVEWLLDGQPIGHLDAAHRSVSQWSPSAGMVESRLNLSLARPVDGGRYACRASNAKGSVEHAARLNVYGPPAVRSVPPIRAVAGFNATIHCPYSGFPISEIRWQRAGSELPRSGRVSVSGQGSLRLWPAEAADGGLYTCTVRAPHSHYAQNDLQIVVRIPPKISGFSFPTDLIEGSSVQVLCGITSGDKPVYFSWLKDGHPIPPSLQVKEKSQDEFSFLIFSHLTSKHSGDYTCIVTNSAAEVSHSATLAVKVQPSWEFEPQDTSALLGSEVSINCAAQGHPEPKVVWMKEQGTASDDFRPVTDLDLQLMTLDNGTLVIASAGNYHEGRYKCQVSNGIGRGLSRTITVTINEPAQLEFSTRNVTVKSGAPVSLTCDARGDPPITLMWTHDSKQLDLSTYRMTVSEKRSPMGGQSVLSVTSAERADGGIYRCRADNAFGWDEMVIYLTVQEYPSAVEDLVVIWRGSRGARLRWGSGGPSGGHGGPTGGYRLQQRALPAPPVLPSSSEWLHTPYVHLPADTLTHIQDPSEPGSVLIEYLLENLRPGTAYALRVAAVNEVGVSPYCQPVILRTLEEAPSAPPQNVEVQALVPGELSVKWKSPPQESWNGELLGYVVTWHGVGPSGGPERAASVRGRARSHAAVAPLAAGPARLRLRAFSAEGLGPAAAPLTAVALEGAPSAAPTSVRCAAMSPQSLRVWWEPLAQSAHMGYDVIFEEAGSLVSVPQWRRAVGPEMALPSLQRGGNYSISVRGSTAHGPGPASVPIYCTTPEDVPGAPTDLRAVPDSESSVVLSWLPPVDPNGQIKHYTVYYRPQRSGGPQSVQVPAPPVSAAAAPPHVSLPAPAEAGAGAGAGAGAALQLWLTASSGAGEGPACPALFVQLMPRAPAKIVSPERLVTAAVGSRVALPCVAGGSPAPLRHWARHGHTHGHGHSRGPGPGPGPGLPVADDTRLLIDGPLLVILSLDTELADNYTCVVRNPWGSDRVTHSVRALRPPHEPSLRILHATHAGLRLAWQHPTPNTYDTASVTGYTLEYSMEGSSVWSALHLPASAREHELTSLACGAGYRARVTALSVIGPSPTSQEISAATSGGKTKPPPVEEILSANSTCVRINVLAWETDGCGVTGWEVGVRPVGGSGGPWERRGVPVGGSVASLCDLQPAAWYQLRLAPLSEAQPAPALYHFSTLTVDGERIPMLSPPAGWAAPRVAALVSAGALLAAAALAAALWTQRSSCARPPAPPPPSLPAARKAGERTRSSQQLYSSAPGKLPPDNQDLYEISPYATFSMPAAPLLGSVRTPPRAPPLVATPGKRRSPLNPEEYTLSRALTLPVRESGPGSDSESSADGQCRACSRPRIANEECVLGVTDSSTESAETRGGAVGQAGQRRRRRNRAARQPPRGDPERRDFTIHV